MRVLYYYYHPYITPGTIFRFASACSVSAVPHLSPFLTELEKMDTSRLMEGLRFMDSLRAENSWSTPKAVYTWVSGLKVWQRHINRQCRII